MDRKHPIYLCCNVLKMMNDTAVSTIAAQNINWIDYKCAVCGISIIFNSPRSHRRIPDFLCSICYRIWSSELSSPWLKFLMRDENRRRMRVYMRLKRRGCDLEFVRFDDYFADPKYDDSNDDCWWGDETEQNGFSATDPASDDDESITAD